MTVLTTLGIDNTGKTEVTKEIQALIDKAGRLKGTLRITPGTYLVSSLFLRSNMSLVLEEGAVLLAVLAEEAYPILDTRVAGIEMPWPAAVLNCNHCQNVTIGGQGRIDGQGPYWWNKYWGEDMHGGMRQSYDARGLRWACDYDCRRVRNVLVSDSKNIILREFTSFQSGFWNIHILYSEDILIDNIHILSDHPASPSTDGIDIDSSCRVEIKNCRLSCNDDSISIKSGRDSDGLRVGRPCHDIRIHDCEIRAGYGITAGSEVSGGIYNIDIWNIRFFDTDCGFRIKSALPRKGYVRHIRLKNLEMINVKYLFHFYLNWNPDYSICSIPAGYTGEIPKHWQTLTAPTKGKNTVVEDIKVMNVTAYYQPSYDGISRAFQIEGYVDSPIKNITFKAMNIRCKEYGVFNYVENIKMANCTFYCSDKHHSEYDRFDNR